MKVFSKCKYLSVQGGGLALTLPEKACNNHDNDTR